jgi:hypothetical protein
MDKTYLEKCLEAAERDYIWTLYFFSSRKQRNAGYSYDSHKVRFTRNADLYSYATQVLRAVMEFQLAPVSQVEEYNGYNTKCSCDRLSVEDEIISVNFSDFRDSLARAIEADVKDSYKGYILEGQPDRDTSGATITFLKFANPTTKLKSKKSIFYKKSENNSLDEVTEQFFRMYLTVDAVLIENNLYTFNHAFEKIFDVEQTLKNVKLKAINTIVDAGFISNPDSFKEFAQSTNSRTFVTLNDERVQRATSADNRITIGANYNIPLNEGGLFEILEKEQSSRLLKYICYKAFKDSETSDILEASSVSKLNVDDTR